MIKYRAVQFGDPAVLVRSEGGATYVEAAERLGDYALRTTDRLLHWAEHAPDRTFMACRGLDGEWQRLTYSQAWSQGRALAQALLERQLSAERPVVILSGNDLQHALLALACQIAGVPFAPVSPAYSLVSGDFAKLRHIRDLLNPGLMFVSDGALYGRALATIFDGVESVLTLDGLLRTAPTAAVEQARLATGPDTIVKFLFTSGSTRMPKAVVTTQRMLCSNQQMLLQCWPFLADEPPVLLDWLPWNHTFGGNKNVNMVLFNGGTLYIDEGKPTAQGIGATLANLREIAPTIYFNVAKGWEDIAQALQDDAALARTFYSRLRLHRTELIGRVTLGRF